MLSAIQSKYTLMVQKVKISLAIKEVKKMKYNDLEFKQKKKLR